MGIEKVLGVEIEAEVDVEDLVVVVLVGVVVWVVDKSIGVAEQCMQAVRCITVSTLHGEPIRLERKQIFYLSSLFGEHHTSCYQSTRRNLLWHALG